MTALLIFALLVAGYAAGVITTRWIRNPVYCARCRRYFEWEDDFYRLRGPKA